MARKGLRVIVGSVLLGLCASAFLKVYPETVSYSGGFGPRAVVSSYDEPCSLLDILAQGFTYRPAVCDAVIVRRRSPAWLLWYAIIIPISAGLAYLVIRLGQLAVAYGFQSASRIGLSVPRQILAALAAVAILSHIILVLYVAPIGLGRLDPSAIPLRIAATTGRVLLPFTLPNRYFLFGLGWLEVLIEQNTSPRLGFAVRPMDSPWGFYHYNGPLWEGLCVALLIVAWIFIIGGLCDFFARSRRARPQ